MKNIGSELKRLREKSNMTGQQAVDKLKELGIEISAKTLYGYESGRNSTNADMFLSLCKIYGCHNVMDTFYDAVDDVLFTNDEWNIIEKYRLLDTIGKETIDYILNHELHRIRQLENSKADTEATPTRIIAYYQKLASAGTGQIVFEDMPVDRVAIPDIPEYKRVSYAISVNGDSMSPLYEDGDMLLVEPTCNLNIGEIGIFIVGNECFVKQLGQTELISLNKGYENIPLTEDSKCMGRIVNKMKM